ncbi:hypothetical protein SEA_JEMERALD_53 [Microbacterium phage Jemerald]|nr:hypothetical protein SEA_JUICER_53 [Microbacterium phage Juicer]WNO27292.1 hypothetical protein SEA_JEMERALD_53 [Microbacterium phage Jemerald]
MSEKKIDLIAQLLAKAESTTPEEAEALMEHAARLMKKYMIDQAVIDERRAKAGQKSEKIVEEPISFTGAYRGEMLNLCNSVVYGLGTLRGMQSTARNKVFTFWLVGFESDVAQAKLLINSLQVQAAVAVRAWWKEHKEEYRFDTAYDQEKARRSFVHGFGTGAGMRIREQSLQTVQEASKGTDIVLVSRKGRVDDHMDEKAGLKAARQRKATAGGSAAGYGYQAGQRANTGSKVVDQGRGIEA